MFLQWSDPVRTLGSYFGILSVLFGAHYLPLTQMVLKGGVTALGRKCSRILNILLERNTNFSLSVVSVTESASRMLGNRSLSAQLRPKEYKTFPESTLNATLKDVHDFIQYAAVEVQKIIFGQDLQKTFAVGYPFSCCPLFFKLSNTFVFIDESFAYHQTVIHRSNCLVLARQSRIPFLVGCNGRDLSIRHSSSHLA